MYSFTLVMNNLRGNLAKPKTVAKRYKLLKHRHLNKSIISKGSLSVNFYIRDCIVYKYFNLSF